MYALYVGVAGLKRKLKCILVTNMETFWCHLFKQHFRPLNLLSSIHTSVYFIRYFNGKSVISCHFYTFFERLFVGHITRLCLYYAVSSIYKYIVIFYDWV